MGGRLQKEEMTCTAIIRHPLDFINRWRHTHGYGVHSPLAFRIVKECIRPDAAYAYYADEVADHELHDHPRARRQARLLIRLQAQLPTDRLLATGADPRTAFLLPAPAADPTLMVCFGKGPHPECPFKPTLTIAGRDYAILIKREGMQPVSYRLL